ncbi:MAG TPA: sigma-70 family RNA polymerase sigma factor [Candidatus Limnocylindria bacterium]|nr:sigma-70 family RNA polymerase sigma factor [Candidatus Limnocylindria bacterium]
MAMELALRAYALPVPVERARLVTFTEVVRDHEQEVFGLALRILGDRDAAHEAAQTAFIKAYRAFDRYDPSRPIRHWLLKIAANEALSLARARSRELARRASDLEASAVAGAAPDPEREAVRGDEAARVRAAVLALPERYRVPIVLRYFNDLSVEEVARVTGRPASTVGVQLLRGRAMLRNALGSAL